MLKPLIVMLILLTVSSVAQETDSVQNSTDSIDYVRSKRMSATDLAKKREGVFVTGLPDISSDPVTGFGFGVRSNVYWNGYRTDSLFAYTPYFVKLKANAAYYTSAAREFVLSLDVPYIDGSRWRVKVDFKAQQNPTNLYFGLTQNTLEKLSLPSNPERTFAMYDEYNDARMLTRAGASGEATLVSDVLSNRFSETEYMLNLKADYALGDGRWRIMGGYEIQHLSYSTFEGTTVDAVDAETGAEVRVPNGMSLLQRDFAQNRITGLEGGWISLLQTALIFDTRDYEPDPTRGVYFEVANEFSGSIIGSEYNFNKLFVQARMYIPIEFGSRTVLAGRVGIGNIFGDQAPFFEFQDQWSPEGSINALGGRSSLRGYRANRFLARSLWFTNIELRTRLFDFNVVNQNISIGVAPFFDAGTVRDDWKQLNFGNLKFSVGGGIRIGWNQSTIISLDYGRSREDGLFYFGIGQIF